MAQQTIETLDQLLDVSGLLYVHADIVGFNNKEEVTTSGTIGSKMSSFLEIDLSIREATIV